MHYHAMHYHALGDALPPQSLADVEVVDVTGETDS